MRKIHPLWFAIAVIGATSNLASSAGNFGAFGNG